MELPPDLLDAEVMAFDVDGTLAGADHLVSDRTLRALAALDAAGVEPVVITGRIAADAAQILHDAGVEGFAIASGGAVTVDTRTGERLRVATMDPAEVRGLVDLALARGVEPILFTAEEMVLVEGSPAYPYLAAVTAGAEPVQVPAADLPTTGITKAMLFGQAADVDALGPVVAARFPRMTRSMDWSWEMSAAGADKWAALAAVLDRLGVPPVRAAGVGDGDNDLVWLAEVGTPVAVANARPAVKALARLEIGDHGADAVAELIEALVAARSRRAG
ncbi:Cof-type HAD-IIB family hydrolase [Georgenia sp. TF02-10]|uniref:HAD family hydrolase n=1 Tax=Georgenia sp. TF02-10 TaxID=2917725 RepID=UPI001FA6EA17|nr:HAD family hydrolase [Georgenia sp. TF02-10]UNX55205.1 Cof-type HAD-IIB family hydrolase [Georgenia sp. TF02-10]